MRVVVVNELSNVDKQSSATLSLSVEFVGDAGKVKSCLEFAGQTLRKRNVQYIVKPTVIGPVLWDPVGVKALARVNAILSRRLDIQLNDAMSPKRGIVSTDFEARGNRKRIRLNPKVFLPWIFAVLLLSITLLVITSIQEIWVRFLLLVASLVTAYEVTLARIASKRARDTLIKALEDCKLIEVGSNRDGVYRAVEDLHSYFSTFHVIDVPVRITVASEYLQEGWIEALEALQHAVNESHLLRPFEYLMACKRVKSSVNRFFYRGR